MKITIDHIGGIEINPPIKTEVESREKLVDALLNLGIPNTGGLILDDAIKSPGHVSRGLLKKNKARKQGP